MIEKPGKLMTRLPQRLIAGLVLVVILFVAWSFVGRNDKRTATSDKRGTQVPSKVADTEGTELLRKACGFIEGRKTFRVVVEVEDGMESQRIRKRVIKRTCLLSVARPDRLAMREQGGINGMTFVANGNEFSRGVRNLKKYDVHEAPASLEDVFCDPIAFQLCTATGNPFFRALLSDHVYEDLMYDVTASRDMGVEEIDGHACGHLHLEQNESIWDLWVDTAAAPLIRKVSIQPKESPETRDQNDTALKMSVVFQLHDWDVAPTFSEDEFVFNPPTNCEKVDFLFPQTPRSDFAVQPGSLTSLGDLAPEITIRPLEGPAIPLSDLRGHVVLLNFFATWCGPCKLELPDLQKLWNEFHDNDDFRLFVIGREESAEIIQAFKDMHDFNFPFATDLDRSAFDRFATESIPRTYLIDRHGKIVYQCSGYDFEKKERKKLRALLKEELGKRD